MSTTSSKWPLQTGTSISPSTVVGSNKTPSKPDRDRNWTEEDFAKARPLPLPEPSVPSTKARPEPTYPWPKTFLPTNIGQSPYDSMCKVYFARSGQKFVASGWIVQGNTGIKGIITAGHVVYSQGAWSDDYVVRRCYSDGSWAEEFRGRNARTLQGWIEGGGLREFWDLGAIIPDVPIPDSTPSLPIVAGYNPSVPEFGFFYDTGYPAIPANGFPFNGEYLWESDGPLIEAHFHGNQIALQAYNAMEHGSSGSPWLVYDPTNNVYWAAGLQSSGWNGTPASYSPYFEQRNILVLLHDIGVIR